MPTGQPASAPKEGSTSPPTPLGQFTQLVAYAGIATACHHLGQNGNPLASTVGFVFALLAALKAGQWLRATQVRADRVRHARRLRSFGRGKGAARRGAARDAREAGLAASEGFPLGCLASEHRGIRRLFEKVLARRLELRGPLEKAIAVCGPSGSGKSNLIVEFLLTLKVGNSMRRALSVFLNDPSLELFAVTAKRQHQLGRETVLIGPGVDELAARLGITRDKHGIEVVAGCCNPCSLVVVGPTMYEDVRTLARIIHPGTPPQKASGNQAHFDRRTWQLLELAMLAQLAAEGIVTLEGIRLRLMQPLDGFKEWVSLMTESDFAGGALRDAANAVLALMKQSPEEFSGGYSQAVDRVQAYAPGSPLGACTAPGFELSDLARKPVAVYLSAGLGNPEATQHWMGIMFASMFEALSRAEKGGRVVAVLEEAPQLGWAALNGAMRAAAVLRKAKVSTIWCSQDAVSQYTSVLGRDAARSVTSQFGTVVTFAVRDHEHAKLVSSRAGDETAPDGTIHLQFDSEGVASSNYSGSYAQRPVIRPSEVMTLAKNQMIVVSENLPTFVTELRPYYETPLQRLARPNPYYEE
ncbi:MAG: type IV secretory system conjugative DNA transfer family protein [Lacipirellulaceae bacterium]